MSNLKTILAHQVYAPAARPSPPGSYAGASATPTAPNSAAVAATLPKLKFGFELDFGDLEAALRLSDACDDYSRYVGGCVQEGLNPLVRSCCGGKRAGTAKSVEEAGAQIEELCQTLRKVCDAVGKSWRTKPPSEATYADKLEACEEELAGLYGHLGEEMSRLKGKNPGEHAAEYRNCMERIEKLLKRSS
jgi:uncharacterized protein YukE